MNCPNCGAETRAQADLTTVDLDLASLEAEALSLARAIHRQDVEAVLRALAVLVGEVNRRGVAGSALRVALMGSGAVVSRGQIE